MAIANFFLFSLRQIENLHYLCTKTTKKHGKQGTA